MRRRILQPVQDGCFLDQLPEGEIHFNRVELSGVMAEEFLLRQLGWIKIRLPRRISPSRRSCEELRHLVFLREPSCPQCLMIFSLLSHPLTTTPRTRIVL